MARDVFLREVAFEPRPEDSVALGLAERWEAVVAGRAGLPLAARETKEREEVEGSVWCVSGRPSCTSPHGGFLHHQGPSSEARLSSLLDVAAAGPPQAWPTCPPGPGAAH